MDAEFYGRFTAFRHVGVFPEQLAHWSWMKEQIETAGRLSAKRGHGGLMFADLRDATGKIQLCVKQDLLGEQAFAFFNALDLGDIIGVEGDRFSTQKGEPTVEVRSWTMLSKTLRQP